MRSPLPAAALLGLAACSPQALPPAPSAAAFPARLKALGTEPFWAIDIDGGTIAYTTPERPQGPRTAVARADSGGLLKLTGRLNGEAISVVIAPGACSDGMSDIVYPYSAAVQLGERSLQGCARPPGRPEGPA
jgi:uncharacterized membrane protein